MSWPIWNGIGIRISLKRALGLVGSVDGVVELQLKAEKHVHFLGLSCNKLSFSLEDPEAFLSALSERLDTGEESQSGQEPEVESE